MAVTNLRFYRKSSSPSNPKDGFIWFNPADKKIKLYKDNAWEDYTGDVLNATYSNNTLTITKRDGTNVTIDLSAIQNIESAISTAIGKLDATVRSNGTTKLEVPENKHVAVEVVEVDGKLTSVSVAENDIASAAALSSLSGTVSDLNDVIDVLKGTGDGSIRDIAIDVLTETLVKEGADEAYNSLQEMAAWIQDHPENAAAMNQKVSELEQAVGNLQKADSVTTFGGKTGAITLKNDSEANGTVNFAMNNNQLTGAVYGLKSAAYAETSAFDAAGDANKALEDAKTYTDALFVWVEY